MIEFLGVSNKLMSEARRLKHYYPDLVGIKDVEDDKSFNRVAFYKGLPVILKYYGFDGQFRIELGSYLSDLISELDYVTMTIT